MVYAMIKFKKAYESTVVGSDGKSRQVIFRKDERFEVDVLEEKGRHADFLFAKVPEGSAVQAGDRGKDIDTAILGVKLDSYIEHKKTKLALQEEC